MVGELSTSDADSTQFTYQVSDKRFEVVDNQLKLKAGEQLDFEKEPRLNIKVTSTDETNLSFSKVFTLKVGDVNDTPVAVNDGSEAKPAVVVTSGKTARGINVLGNDSDADGDQLKVTKTNSPDGKVKVNADGTLDFTPQAGFDGNTAISYTVSDGKGGTDTAKVYVKVNKATSANDAPVAVDDYGLTKAAKPVAKGNLLANDSDANDDTLTVKSAAVDLNGDGNKEALTLGQETNITDAAGKVIATLTVNSDGHYSLASVKGYTGNFKVDYTVSDGKGGTATAQLYVLAQNTPPVVVDDGNIATSARPATGNLLTNDSDPDGDTLKLLWAKVDTSGNGYKSRLLLDTATDIKNAAGDVIGTVTVNSDGSYSMSPVKGYTGDLPTLTYRASDGRGGSSIADLIVSNNENANTMPTNSSPTEITLNTTRISENNESAVVGTLTTIDKNKDDTFIYTLNSHTDKFEIVNGQLKLKEGVVLDYEKGDREFTLNITSSDGQESINKNITIQVTDVNETLPVIDTAPYFIQSLWTPEQHHHAHTPSGWDGVCLYRLCSLYCRTTKQRA